MKFTIRALVLSTLVAATALLVVADVKAGILQQIFRWQGCLWGDGYHSQTDTTGYAPLPGRWTRGPNPVYIYSSPYGPPTGHELMDIPHEFVEPPTPSPTAPFDPNPPAPPTTPEEAEAELEGLGDES